MWRTLLVTDNLVDYSGSLRKAADVALLLVTGAIHIRPRYRPISWLTSMYFSIDVIATCIQTVYKGYENDLNKIVEQPYCLRRQTCSQSVIGRSPLICSSVVMSTSLWGAISCAGRWQRSLEYRLRLLFREFFFFNFIFHCDEFKDRVSLLLSLCIWNIALTDRRLLCTLNNLLFVWLIVCR